MSADTAVLPSASAAVPSGPAPVLRDLGERRILSEVLAPRYAGVRAFGDDCAVLDGGLVVTTDSCPDPLLDQLGPRDPYAAGWLLATINLSDLAAAGAEPAGLVVSYTLPADTPVGELEEIVRGVDECCALHGTAVVGGDIRDGSRHLSATAVGRTPRIPTRDGGWIEARLSRRGARAGDRLLLVGNPGNLWGAALLLRGYAERIGAADREDVLGLARQPVAQLGAGRMLAEQRLATACMDVSDGLYSAVRSLAGTNGLGADMERDVELSGPLTRICDAAGLTTFQLAQNWGDWCLLAAVHPADVGATERGLADRGIRSCRVGTLTATAGDLRVGGREWVGKEQERFTPTSWHGDGIEAHISWMRSRSALR